MKGVGLACLNNPLLQCLTAFRCLPPCPAGDRSAGGGDNCAVLPAIPLCPHFRNTQPLRMLQSRRCEKSLRGTMSMATESSTTQSSSRWAQALKQLIETMLCSRGKCATASQWFVIPAPRGCMPCGCMVCFLRAPACVALPLDRINAFHCDMPADQSACNSFHRVLLLCIHPAALLHNCCTTRAPAPCLCTNTRQMLRENDPQLQSTSAQLKRMCIPVCRVADAATPCPSSHLGCVRTTPPQVTAMQLRHPVKAHMSHMPWPAEMLSSRPL